MHFIAIVLLTSGRFPTPQLSARMREKIDNPISMSGKGYSRNEQRTGHFAVSAYQCAKEKVGVGLMRLAISIEYKQGNESHGSRIFYRTEQGRGEVSGTWAASPIMERPEEVSRVLGRPILSPFGMYGLLERAKIGIRRMRTWRIKHCETTHKQWKTMYIFANATMQFCGRNRSAYRRNRRRYQEKFRPPGICGIKIFAI